LLTLAGLRPTGGRDAQADPDGSAGASSSESRWTYRYPRYGFFEQLRVLNDLRTARPPLWTGVSPAESESLAVDYGLQDVKECTQEDTDCNPETWRRLMQQAAIFHWSWISVFFAALIVPTLVLALKWLMPAELKKYYSLDWQARHGNREAQSIQGGL